MDKVGIKATLYDILGYSIPGLILILGVYLTFIPKETIEPTKLSQITVSLPFGIILLLISYLGGYFISSVSSFIFENPLSKKYLANRFYNFDTSRYDEKSQELFGCKYSECQRDSEVYCEHYFPSSYETAVRFLTIYGFSRNSATSLLLVYPFILSNHALSSFWLATYLIIVLFLIHNYFRFRVYFVRQVASSILLPKSQN